ncbi:MAG: preprotein translocase subunit YajC [Eubacteriales bacterium]
MNSIQKLRDERSVKMFGADSMSTITSFGFLALIFGVFYFFTIRPQMKQQKKLQSMRNSLQKGDKILTIGGFYGRVVSFKDNVITVELKPDNVKVQIVKSAIAEIIEPKEVPAETVEKNQKNEEDK